MNGYPVAPRSCKYDAFKVREETPTAPPAAGLTVVKDVSGSFTRTFGWGISKSVDQTEIHQSGTTAVFNYTVRVTHDAGTDSGWSAGGTITVFNPNLNRDSSTVPVNHVTVTDGIADPHATCLVTDGNDVTIDTGSASFAYTCAYSAAPASLDETNTATVSWPDQTLVIDSTDQALAAGTATFAIPFTLEPTLVNDCVEVTDSLGGDLGPVCSTAVLRNVIVGYFSTSRKSGERR